MPLAGGQPEAEGDQLCALGCYAAGELKHGTISLITDGVPVIALATQKNVYEKTISNAKETRSRGARVLLFTTKDAEVPEALPPRSSAWTSMTTF